MSYYPSQAINIKNVIDHMAKPVTTEQYLSAVGDDNRIFESCTLEEVDATYLYDLDAAPVEESKYYDAITTKKNRIDRTMAGFNRALNAQLNGSGIESGTAEIGAPRKAGQFAVMSAQFPLSDGQAISIIFHSPTNDPSKIKENDDLVAFRFLLNKRDVTHVVAPSGGQDISLKQTTLVLANLAERNSERFQAKQADNKAKQDELKTIQDATSQLQTEAENLTTQADELNKQQQDATDAVARTQTLLDKQKARNEALQAQLDGMKPADPVVPEPVIKGDENKPELSTEAANLVNQDNRPLAGYVFESTEDKVVKSSAKTIDLERDNGPFTRKTLTRYTWDGVGYKNKGMYLMKDGTTKSRNSLDELFYSTTAPTDSFTLVRKGLEKDNSYVLDNSAHVSSFKYFDDWYVEIFDSMDKNKTYRINAGDDMIEGAKKLYTAYKAGKAAGYLVTDVLPRDQPYLPKSKPAGVGDTVTDSDGSKYKVTSVGMGSAALLLDGDSSSTQYSIEQLNSMGVIVGGVNDEDYVDLAKGLLSDIEHTTNPDGTLDFATQDRLVDYMKKLQVSEYTTGLVYGAQQAVNARNMEIRAAQKDNPEPAGTVFNVGDKVTIDGKKYTIGAVGSGSVELNSAGQSKFDRELLWADDATEKGIIIKDLNDRDYASMADKVIQEVNPKVDKSGFFDVSVRDALIEKMMRDFNIENRNPASYAISMAGRRIAAKAKENNVTPEPTPEPQPTEQSLYWYGLRARPLGVGAQPAGQVDTIASENVMTDPRTAKLVSGMPSDTAWRWGAIAYDRPLTDKEISDYELVELKEPMWTPESRAEKFAAFKEWMNSYLQNKSLTEFINEAIKPNASMINDSPFSSLGIYYPKQLTLAFQEAGYTGGIISMVNALYDELTATGEDSAVTKALADLQNLLDNETNVDAYLMKMESAFNDIDAAGKADEYNDFMNTVADKLTALMDAEEVK